MPKKKTYLEMATTINKFKDFLKIHAITLPYPEAPEKFAYFYPVRENAERDKVYFRYHAALHVLRFIQVVPLDEGPVIIFTPDAEAPQHTITSTHMRLPKLSHLITLIPRDFFTLFRILSTAKNAPGNALALNLGGAGVSEIPHAINSFFKPLYVNHRINDEYCNNKWTERRVIKQIAALHPTQETHLSSMQYLTAHQNEDLDLFPVEAQYDFDLEWDQYDDDYVIPPGAANNFSRF